METHPFAHFDLRARRVLWRVLVPLTLACGAAIAAVDVQLRTEDVPHGIVQFELAGDPIAVGRILQSWSETPGRSLYAAFSLGLDFLFLSLYAPLLALACAGVAERFGARVPGARSLGVGLSWGQLLAGALDAAENVALFRILLRDPPETLATVAFACATAKFGLLGAGLAYLVAGLALGGRGGHGGVDVRGA